MLQFQIHFREPAIERLPVHLLLHQNIVFNQHANLEYVANANKLRKTMLTQWFETNAKNPEARELLYIEFPSKFVWDDEREWKCRKRGGSLGRIAFVHPAAGELYYLRMLLNY